MHAPADLTGLAVVGLAALLCGLLFARLNQPPIVGYILAGALLGPGALGLVEDREAVSSLADLGVLLLLFLVGLELSIRAFLVMWRLALSAVALQVAGSLLAVLLCSFVLGLDFELALLLGFVVSLSSTAVAIKMLEQIGESKSRVGRIAVAVLIAQDLAFLPMLLTVQSLGSGGFGLEAALRIVLAVVLLALVLQILGRRRRVELPFAGIVVKNADLSPLTGLVYCFGIGAVFGLAGLSPAYGAFMAGLVVGRSAQRGVIIETVQPIQSVLVMTFFLSVGLLLDVAFIWNNLGTVLLLLLVVALFKTALNVAVLRFLGETWRRAFLGGTLIAQIGEFSFLLAASGLAAGAIDEPGSRLVVAVTVLSLALSPLWLGAARRVHNVAAQRTMTFDSVMDVAFGGQIRLMRGAWDGVSRVVRRARLRDEAAPRRLAPPSGDGDA